jgi:hypothetical protein
MKKTPLLLLLVLAGFAAAFALNGGTSPRTASADGATLNFPSASCGNGTASVSFSWTPVSGATMQFLDLSIFDNGFAPDTFLGSPLAPNQSTLVWNGILTDTAHVWRVNALTPSGWVTSATGAFVACGTPRALGVSPACQNRNLTTGNFRWAALTPAPVTQYLDLGWDPYFSPGSYYGSQQTPTTSSVSWPNIPANITQYYRINALTADGVWHSSPAGSFIGDCVPSAAGAETALGDRLVVPSAGIDAQVSSMQVGYDGVMPDPIGYFNAVLYDFSALSGLGGYYNAGNIVLAGHVDCGRCYDGGSGTAVFWNVRTMQVGETAQYITAAGEVQNYQVVYSYDADPNVDWAPIVGSGSADMTLITCIGTFSGGHYDLRHVVGLRKI